MMRGYGVAAFLAGAVAAALGVGLSAGPAVADPIDDAWPYDTFISLPGYSVGGHLTPVDWFPFLSQGVLPWTIPDAGSYSADFIGIQIPFVGYLIHQEVFDSTAGFPPDGTTWDGLSFGLLSNFLINDPVAGFGDQFTFAFIENTFISDAAGIRDVLTVFDQSFTLFDFPAVAAASLPTFWDWV